MAHVYVVLFHKNVVQLARLIQALNYRNTYFVIHVCKNFLGFPELRSRFKNFSNVFFCERERATWGSYYIAKATLNGINSSIQRIKNFDYLSVISAQDYPIKSNEYIYSYLEKNKGKEFLTFEKTDPELNERNEYFHPIKEKMTSRDLLARYEMYFIKIYKNFYIRIPGEYDPKINFEAKLKNAIKWVLRRTVPKRKFISGYESFLGSNWFTISYDCCLYMINSYLKNVKYHKFMKFVFSSSEMFFQTILLNSRFRNSVINDNLRFTKWGVGPNPVYLKKEHLKEIEDSGPTKLFARKFDITRDPIVLEEINKNILGCGATPP